MDLRFPLFNNPPQREDKGKDIPVHSLPCVGCGKDVHPENRSSVPRSEINHVGWDWAVAGIISGGYGSRYDTVGFAICICDECIDRAMSEKKLVKVYEGLNRGFSFDQPIEATD